MKSKIVIMSASALFAAGVGFHAAHYCPLQHMMNSAKSAQQAAPKTTTPAAQPTFADAKTSLVKK